jgi:deazaflavin-dependent oxidoreductase (nitroreductase family)
MFTTWPGKWFIGMCLWRLDRALLLHGRRSLSAVVGHVPVKLIGVIGRTTGQRRYIPLVNVPGEGGKSYSVNSYGGLGVPPQWFHNLQHNPADVTVQDEAGQVRCCAYLLSDTRDQEYLEAWQKLVQAYPPMEDYAHQAAKHARKLVIICFAPYAL